MLASACTAVETGSSPSHLDTVLLEGILMPPDQVEAGAMRFHTVEVVEGRMSHTTNIVVRLHFPVVEELFFEKGGGRLLERLVIPMDFVSKGDVLARVIFDEEVLQLEERELMMRMADAERRHTSDRLWMRADIEQFRLELFAISDANEAAIEAHSIAIERKEASYRHAIRQFERLRRDQNRQLQYVRDRLQGEELIAPFDAVVAAVNPVMPNTIIYPWMSMITLYDYHSFQLEITAPFSVLRYGDIVTLGSLDGSLRTEARVISDPLATGHRSQQFNYVMEVLDESITAEPFMGNVSAFPTVFDIDGVVIVPSRAIHEENERRFVHIYEDGIIRKRYVQIGFNYHGRSQVLDGLLPGQLVVIHQ